MPAYTPLVLPAGSPAASLAFSSSKHSPTSCHHQILSESAAVKLYFFGASSCPIMTMEAVAPPVCLMPPKCPFSLQNQICFLPKVFLYSLCYYLFTYSVFGGGDNRGIQLHLKVCAVLCTRPKAYKKCPLQFPSLHEISTKFFLGSI